jgi:SAM-dependent methyltransferase
MLAQARHRTRKAAAQFRWIQAAYDRPLCAPGQFDLVLFSYSLSKMNPGWKAALEAAAADLAPGGRLAVVDFDQTPIGWFQRWMRRHHVRLDGRLLPALCKRFRPRLASREPAFHGGWEYFLFLGTSRSATDAQGGRGDQPFRRARMSPLTSAPAVPVQGLPGVSGFNHAAGLSRDHPLANIAFQLSRHRLAVSNSENRLPSCSIR